MRRIFFFASVLSLSASTLFAADSTATPVPEKELLLEGGSVVERMALDAVAGRLYVAHSGVVDVIDVAKGERIGIVEGVDRARGVAVVPEAKVGFASSAKNNVLVVFELETLKKVKEIPVGDGPDAVIYVATTKEIWVFNGGSKDVTVVDPVTREKRKDTIKLEGKPESAVEYPSRGIVYVNVVGSFDGVTAIDARGKRALGHHTLSVGVDPTGLALDLKTGLLFAGCKNQKLVLLDSTTWKVVADFDIPEQCEGVAFDPVTANIFVSCQPETKVFHLKDAKTCTPLGTLATPGGKTCLVDAKTRRVFVTTGPKKGEDGDVRLLTFLPPK